MSARPNLLLSHFPHASDDFERGIAGTQAELILHAAASGVPVPEAARSTADALIHYPVDRPIDGAPEAYPKVRVVLRVGVGFDAVDVAAWAARGVPVFNVPDYGTAEVADHALALMLALTRGTATYHDAVRADPKAAWRADAAPAVRRLRGAVFGVLGLGRIGLAAATRARGFGMTIAFHDPYLSPGTEIAVDARRCASLSELMAIADILSIHAPSSAETRGMVDDAAFERAKPGLIVVNTARGAIIDLDALGRALRSGKVMAAGLDVLPQEPADPGHPLIAAWRAREPWIEGRLTLSPHAAFYSPDALADMRRKSIETVLGYLATGDTRHSVNGAMLRQGR